MRTATEHDKTMHGRRRRGRRWTPAPILIGLLVVLSTVVGTGGAPAAADPPAPVLGDGSGIHVVDATWVDSRKVDVTISTDALPMPVHVLVIVPTGYLADPAVRYPSIYLLNGCNAFGPYTGLEYRFWEDSLHIEANTTSVPAIFVMPEGGAGGFYTDWVHAGSMGRPLWETFHIEQLVPWIDQNFRTIADRAHRGIMGISMGGFGSLSYPARHPDLFSAATSFSGAADTTTPPEQAEPLSNAVVSACAASDGGDQNSTFGSHAENELNWRAHDPAQLVENLSNTSLYLYTGNGQPGPLDPPGVPVDGIEVLAHQATLGFMAALQEAGGTAFLDDYGAGTHRLPYWQRDFADVLPKFMADFASPKPVTAFTFKTADASYERFGWQVHLDRSAAEFSVLRVADPEHFNLSGSGSATVTTAGGLLADTDYIVTTNQDGVVHATTVRTDSLGRLTAAVPLGPANAREQFSAGASTTVFTTEVSLSPGVAPVTTTTSSTVPPTVTQPAATPLAVQPTYTG